MQTSLLRGPALAAALSILVACGGRKDAAPDADSATAAQEAADSATAEAAVATSSAPAAQAGPSSSAPLAAADVDRWKRGMDAELVAVRAAGTKLRSAKTPNDTASLMMQANDMGTRDAGAKAAGVDPERYQFIRTTLESAVAQLTPLEQEWPNLKEMPASMVDELKKGRETALARMSSDVPPAVIEALRPRAAELRNQSLTLAGERMKAAGLAR
jgi:hypothetical protein